MSTIIGTARARAEQQVYTSGASQATNEFREEGFPSLSGYRPLGGRAIGRPAGAVESPDGGRS
jgi:hypothetical protein